MILVRYYRVPHILALIISSYLLCANLMAVAFGMGEDSSVLIVSDATLDLKQYRRFWESLEARKHTLHFVSSQENSQTDPIIFKNLILFASGDKNISQQWSPQSLLQYLQDGGNLLLIVSVQSSEIYRDFAREFDVEFDAKGTEIVDHFDYASDFDDDDFHTMIQAKWGDFSEPFLAQTTVESAPVLYKGVGHSMGRSPLLTPLLLAPPSSFSVDLQGVPEDEVLSGNGISLVSCMQTLNNARVCFSGSPESFTDSLASSKVHFQGQITPSGNTAFLRDLTNWNFHATGNIRASNIGSTSANGAAQDTFRVNEMITYTVDLSAFWNNSWHPHELLDLQVELSMLDPHLRTVLQVDRSSRDANNTHYLTTFQAPDKHGVYTLRLDYRRPGWSRLRENKIISITPPRHDEYDRFIINAIPHYGGALSVSAGFVLFLTTLVLQWTNMLNFGAEDYSL